MVTSLPEPSPPSLPSLAAAPAEHAPEAGANHLLAALDDGDREALVRQMEPVRLGSRDRLYDAGDPITHVYFPLRGLVSVVAVGRDGATVEVGPVGCDGMVGLPVFLGGGTDPLEAFAQVAPLDTLRLRANAFGEAAERLPSLQRVMRRYVQWTYYGMAQWVLCARLHSAEERLARWLLMCHDRVGADSFPMTHKFMAEMLGVRRPTVSLTLSTLRHAGLLEAERGTITIVDRPGLEAASCECWRISTVEYRRLLGRGPECRPEPAGGGVS